MEGISLNQYISNYKEIVLKLKGINEFQVLRHFMRGLHLDYEAYVEPKQSKDWVEALKFAQIYDDIGCRLKGAFGKGKEKEPFSLKRKFLKKKEESSLVAQIYVDDIIFGATKHSLCEEFIKLMQEEFKTL